MPASELDLVLSGGRALLPDGTLEIVDLGIRDGRIAGIAATGTLQGASRVDLSGLVVLPGVIDAHIHLGHGSDITRPRVAADADAESASAAAGGVTAFVSYLIADGPHLAGPLDEAIAAAGAGSRIDFGFHLVVATEEQLAEVERAVAERGVTSFKLFMYNRGGEGARLGLPDTDDGFLFRLLEATRRAGAIVCPHCENIEVGWVLRDRLVGADPDGSGGLAAWNDSRPPLLEAEAVHRVASLARLSDARFHMVHCSSGAGLEAATTQRRLGAKLTIETCVQYLTHTVDSDQGLKAKVNPPVRAAEDVEALWRGLADGSIDTVATDHVHRDATAKIGGVWKASPGFPGMETLLPIMLSEGHHRRGLPLGSIARLLSGHPARIMGMPGKGRIGVGFDADLAVVDLDALWTVRERDMHSSAGFSIYDGWEVRGRVIHTLSRGAFALRDGMLCDDRVGKGRYIERRSRSAGTA
ncbi:dihydroorotase family protein [Methylobacterium sp. NEAU 140]|uniref:dihydroorotase n=1 Tax=Methylobacterium sp. NEAU 140 TaxID=3064945 RepID=UPI0027372CB8|nr:dihydroorotase family protein [Methylobacterium sp. NEAU 140]MDP4026594.1 dihydroorotase family protein [Methylobacterium sp. NEAU 140]